VRFVIVVDHLLPGRPSNVTLNVSGRSSLYVAFNSPISTQEMHHVTATRYCGKTALSVVAYSNKKPSCR